MWWQPAYVISKGAGMRSLNCIFFEIQGMFLKLLLKTHKISWWLLLLVENILFRIPYRNMTLLKTWTVRNDIIYTLIQWRWYVCLQNISHVSKRNSDFKQKCIQLTIPFSVFHALSHAVWSILLGVLAPETMQMQTCNWLLKNYAHSESGIWV